MQNFWKLNKEKILLLLIILLGAFFRLYGLNWDQNQHLHPDERFLTMVTQTIKWPSSISEYFSTSTSPLNPHNVNYGFFVYGTFPVFLTKFLSEIFKLTDYNNLTLFGRFLSGISDILVILLVFLIGKKVFSPKVGLFASFFYSISVLPIQLSHFYTTDIFLNFFSILSLYLIVNFIYSKRYYWIILSGLVFGLALASKISAITFSPAFIIIFLFLLPKLKLKVLLLILLFALSAFLTFRVFQPYAFSGHTFFDININPKFIQNLQELKNLSQPGGYFPPSVQWSNTTPILYPLRNMILWGLGLPLGITALLSIPFAIFAVIEKILRNFRNIGNQSVILTVLFFTALTVFTYQGIQFVKPMRYFIIIYPLLSLMSGYFLAEILKFGLKKFPKTWMTIAYSFLSAVFLIWPLAFFSIYTKPISRVTASKWIYDNVPNNSFLLTEHWDDPLPLKIEQIIAKSFRGEQLPVFYADTADKWQVMNQLLNNGNFLILSSNRGWGSIPTVPERYPKMTKFYSDLFAEKLAYKKVAEFTSYPSLRYLGISIDFPDQSAEETFTVYDHPKVIIFKKI